MALQEVYPMSSGTLWRSHRPRMSLSKSVFFAMTLHLMFLLVLVMSDFIPPWHKKPMKLRAPGTPGVIGITMGGGKSPEPKGEERKLDVKNPTPPKPKPPKPVAQPPKVEKKPIARPVEAPKPEVKKAEVVKKPEAMPPVKTKRKTITSTTKEALATPPPKAEEESKDTKNSKEKVKDSLPELADASAVPGPPSVPSALDDLPTVDQKGKKDGGLGVGAGAGGGLPKIGDEEGIEIPPAYIADAFNRISGNFGYPSYYNNQLKAPVLCRIGFRVAMDGRISGIQVEQSSGDPSLDDFAKRAVEKTLALLPLPEEIKTKIGKESIGASFPFIFGNVQQ